MLDLVLPIYNFQLTYAQKLTADVPEEQLCAQPIEGRIMNHPAFLLGHLAWASDMAVGLVGGDPTFSDDRKELFAMTSKPDCDRTKYPSKEILLHSLEDSHRRLTEAVKNASPELLAGLPPERMRARFPTLGHALAGLMTAHEANHLGQFSAWRRAMGSPSVF